MVSDLLQDICTYIDFTEHDAQCVAALRPVIEPHLDVVVDRFYGHILQHPGARSILTGGPEQAARLREAHRQWMGELFGGTYDSDYVRRRKRIGQAHVQIAMPQHYMVAAMQTAWTALHAALYQPEDAQRAAQLVSLHKLLMLDLALILESYRTGYTDQIREDERAAVRDRLSQAEHMAHIGHLAASLAHEIKNPLAGVSGAIQVMRDALEPKHPHRPVLVEVLRQIDRLDGTVKDLLVYARPRPPRFTRTNLGRAVERVLALLAAEPALQAVTVALELGEHLDCYADETQLEQLIMNLALNGAQASPAGATLRISAAAQADGVRFTVEDEGPGMSDATLRQAFEPFFTTKTKGTGLGLPICRKIAEAHGGTIALHSSDGAGASVTVRLPRFPPATSGGLAPDEYPRPNR